MDDATPSRPGRRRSEDSRRAILAAAVELVGEHGYGPLTVEKIAARAGTGKQTIYRWWPTKADVVMEALVEKADLHIPVPDDGSLSADLRAFLGASVALGRAPQVVAILRALMAEAQLDEGFGARFRDGFIENRRSALRTVLERAAERGELPPGASVDTLLDVVFGVIWYRVLTGRVMGAESVVDELVALIAR
ncbi:TetR/AcrR family transcriptional regulator [Luteimicrobium sp. NPDC057192]|uniref:TetR/AcrR family transcriptional regulator n=1 Tax=Luteimicrobium sp. NPDC057192 TaxID=3346042 RepID=UPI003626F280